MGFVLLFLSIWVCSFAVGRIFSFIGGIGGKWSPFAKTYWKNDLIIAFAQSLLISIIIVAINSSSN